MGQKPKKLKSLSERLWRGYYSIAKRSLVPLVKLLQAGGWKCRFVNFYGASIGHMTWEPDSFIKEGLLGLRSPVKAMWVSPSNLTANKHLLGYWKQYLHIWESPFARLWLPVAQSEKLGRGYLVVHDEAALYPKIQSAWGDRAPLLKLTRTDYERGWAVLKKLGVPEGAWFVCIHGRESGFHDDPVQVYRNVDIRSYFPAMEMIVERGGWCIRMGDKTMTPLPKMPHVVDYAVHDIKTDWMDVFLCAACKCFLGSNSGLCGLSNIFGVPAAMANQIPLSVVLPYGIHDLGTPKLLWSAAEKRYLTYKEVFECSPEGNLGFALDEKAGLKVVDNTPDEIRELAAELLEVATGTVQYSAEDEELQCRFKSLMQPNHYSYGAVSRVGRHFLRKHANLLANT